MSTAFRRCRSCGARNRLGAKVCYLCGAPFPIPDQKQQVPLQKRGIQRQQQRSISQQREGIMLSSSGLNKPNTRRKATRGWRSPRLFLPLLLVFLVLIVGIGLAVVYLHTNTTGGSVPPLPTPGSARATYTNAQFGYTLVYPTQWYLTTLSNSSMVRVFMKHDPSVPEAVAFEIRCNSNPNQLDAKTYWQQSLTPNSGEIGKGAVTFSSGVSAYAASGQGQTPFTIYTLTHSQVACTILVPETDPANASIVTSTINSFRW